MIPALDSQTWPVGDLAVYIRDYLESDEILASIWVRGEVSNVFRARSGHTYFTLRDDDGQLKAALFKAQGQRSRYIPTDGDAVVAHGSVSLYPRDGALQLYVDLVQQAGAGLEQMRLDLLRQQLDAEGLFEPSRKRPLPAAARRIGVVTSPDGSVWHDIQHVVGRRYPLIELVLAPARVQGNGAPETLIAGLRALQHEPGIDVIIIGRGGGSAEDLAAFNDEQLARAIFRSAVPVVSAVGHETDWSICDLVADVRAPTPSAAAEIVTPSVVAVQRDMLATIARIRQLSESHVRHARMEWQGLSRRLDYRSPAGQLLRRRSELQSATRRLIAAHDRVASSRRDRLDRSRRVLDALSPNRVLERGYAVVSARDDGSLIDRVGRAEPGLALTIRVRDGRFDASVSSVNGRGASSAASSQHRRGGRRPAGDRTQMSMLAATGITVSAVNPEQAKDSR